MLGIIFQVLYNLLTKRYKIYIRNKTVQITYILRSERFAFDRVKIPGLRTLHVRTSEIPGMRTLRVRACENTEGANASRSFHFNLISLCFWVHFIFYLTSFFNFTEFTSFIHFNSLQKKNFFFLPVFTTWPSTFLPMFVDIVEFGLVQQKRVKYLGRQVPCYVRYTLGTR